MRFIAAFEKRAAFDRHSDGTEFKTTDNEPMANIPGAGGMAPSGYEVYEPLPGDNSAGKKNIKELRRRFVLLGKLGSPQDWLMDGPARMDTADAVSGQLKYETGRDWREGWRDDGYRDKLKKRKKK